MVLIEQKILNIIVCYIFNALILSSCSFFFILFYAKVALQDLHNKPFFLSCGFLDHRFYSFIILNLCAGDTVIGSCHIDTLNSNHRQSTATINDNGIICARPYILNFYSIFIGLSHMYF